MERGHRINKKLLEIIIQKHVFFFWNKSKLEVLFLDVGTSKEKLEGNEFTSGNRNCCFIFLTEAIMKLQSGIHMIFKIDIILDEY
jgi:hypothetical protein